MVAFPRTDVRGYDVTPLARLGNTRGTSGGEGGSFDSARLCAPFAALNFRELKKSQTLGMTVGEGFLVLC